MTGFSIVYGVANNDCRPLDNSKAGFLSHCSRDEPRQFAERISPDAGPRDGHNPGKMCHGRTFAKVGLGKSGVASMDIVNEIKRI